MTDEPEPIPDPELARQIRQVGIALDQMARATETGRRGRPRTPAIAAAVLVVVTLATLAVWTVGRSDDTTTVETVTDTSTTSVSADSTGAVEPSPAIASLEAVVRAGLACLEAEGFDVYGPVPRSDGRGFEYMVGSPSGGPVLTFDNRCEDDPLLEGELSLNATSKNFQLSASLADRQVLAERLPEVARCLGVAIETAPSDRITTTHPGVPDEDHQTDLDEIERDIALEQRVLTALRESADRGRSCIR